jgi:hypothetical protein
VASATRLSWSEAVTSTGPRVIAARTSAGVVAGSVNRTAAGWASTKVASALVSEVRTMFPGSTRRIRGSRRSEVAATR